MSTSSEHWMEPSSSDKVYRFHYPEIQPQDLRAPEGSEISAEKASARESARQQELQAAVETAKAQAFLEGEAQAKAAAVQQLEQARTAVTAALGDFVEQRSRYFSRVEAEVVRLSLAIARKVLHREAQMDPLLLVGIVRVALDQMQAGTRVMLRAAPERVGAWRDLMTAHGPANLNVEVAADESLQGHRCRLEAEAGSTEISLDGQLEVIESGFFDLLRSSEKAHT